MLKIYAENGETLERLDEVACAVASELKQRANIYAELTFVSARKIKKINAATRGVDKVTDVLSFPMLDGVKGASVNKKNYPLDFDPDKKAVFLGSIVICMDRVRSQAKKFGHSEERETYYLIVHALLHLFGFDHELDEDKEEMREKEEKIMKKLGILR